MRSLAQSRLELENVKKKKQPWKSVESRARIVTYPKLEDDFNKAEEERHAKDNLKADAGKQGKKKTEDEACHAQIERDNTLKTFRALSTFRRKDDLITLAGALKLERDGTVHELKTRIKEFLADTTKSQHFADDPRFAALFQAGSKARWKISATSQVPTSTNPIASSSNLNRQPQQLYNAYNNNSLTIHPPQFYNYTNINYPRT